MVGRTSWAAWIAALIVFVLPGGAAAQEGRWLRAESRHFVAYSDHSEGRVRDALRNVEEFDALLRRITRTEAADAPRKLELYLFRGLGHLAEVRGRTAGSVAGFYVARPEIVAAFASYREGVLDAQEVLFHEYAHHYMFQYFANAYPAWYVEGFAEYVATTEIESDRITLGRFSNARAGWVLSDDWLPIATLLGARPSSLSSFERGQFYALSWLMVHYCANTSARGSDLQDYFRRLRNGEDVLAAFTAAFEVEPGAFEAELRRYARGQMPILFFPKTQMDVPVAVTRLPAGADDLLLLDARIRRGVDDEDRGALLASVRRRAADHREDPFAVRTLARAEISLGSPAAGRRLLEPMLARDSRDVEALYLTGLSYVAEAQVTEAERETLNSTSRRYFSRAFRLDAMHVPTLYRFAQTFAVEPGPMAPERLDILVHARNLAPQVEEIGINTAVQLLEATRWDEAAAVLRPIAYNPHGGESAERARQLLTMVEMSRAAPH